MKKLGCALAVVLAVLSAALSSEAAVTLYVKPDASGSGASWADAAGLEAAIAAAKSAGGAYDIYLAKGVYYPSATIQLSNGISLYGGFKGDGSDTLETRDLENNATILCGDVDKNDYWEHHDAGTGVVTALPETKIIVEGEIAVPAYTSDYDTYVPASASLSGNLMRLLAVQADATVTLDGLVLTGGGQGNKNNAGQKDDGYNKNFGSGLLIGDRAHATVRSCRVIACSAQYDVVHFGTGVAALEGCSVEHCYGVQYAAVCAATAATAGFTNCTFRGNARVNNANKSMSNDDSAAAVKGFAALTMNNCLFERNTLIKTFGDRHCAAAVLALPSLSTIIQQDKLVGLRFVGNVTWSGTDAENAGQPSPLVSFGNATYKPSGWLFERNVGFSSGVADPSRIGLAFDVDFDLCLSDSTFVSNTLYVTGLAADAKLAVAPVVSSKRAEFVNCTFLDNDVQVSQSEGATVRASRALLSYRAADDADQCWVAAFNGTFAGETALPDILVAGFQDNDVVPNCSFAGNSILWASGAAASVPRAIAYGSGAADFIELSRCIVRAPELLTQRVKTDETVVEEDPLLEPLAFLSASDFVPVLRCGAKTPQIRNSFDVRMSLFRDWPVLTYLSGGATSGGQTRCGNTPKPAADLVGDALGAARPSGSFTLGAVQSLAPVAESGVTVCCRVRPAGSGMVDGRRFATVVSAVGGTLEPVVAVAEEDRQFDSWRNESMELLSEELSFAPSTAVAGSSYADAWFVNGQGEVVITPDDDLQAALDFVSAKGTGAVCLGAGDYKPETTLTANGTRVVVRADDGAVIRANASGAKIFDVYDAGADHGWGMKVVFDGVTFSQGRVDVGYAEAEFLNCRLQDCPGTGGSSVLTSRTNLFLSGTSFIGNTGLSVARPTEQWQPAHASRWTVTNCCFTGNTGGPSGPGLSSGAIDIELLDSKFERNVSVEDDVNGLCQVGADAICRIQGCVFSENLVSNSPSLLYFSTSTGTQVTLTNCLFMANKMGGGMPDGHGAAILNSFAGCLVYNTTFLSNVVDVTRSIASENAYHASITGGRNAYGLVNCHFEGNRTKITALAEGLRLYSSTSAFLRQNRYPFVGCSYCGNTFDDGEIYIDRYAATAGNSWKAVNCIFWGDAADYKPIGWYDASKNRLDVYYCVIKNAPSEGRSEASIVNIYEGLQTDDPLFGSLVWRENRAYRPIGRGSARRHGAALGVSEAGELVFRKADGNYYRVAPETTDSPVAQTVAATEGDMFGSLPAVAGKFDIGPVQNTCPAPGLVLIVR